MLERGVLAGLPVAAAAVLLAGGCGSPGPPSVVLVVVDTLRADHLGLYGYGRPTSPELDGLAQEGAVFEHAFTAAPWTLPAFASLFTGLLPSRHQAGIGYDLPGEPHFTRLRPGAVTVAELLRARGYATGAVVNAPFTSPAFGLDQGFDTYDHAPASDSALRRADAVLEAALAWLDDHREEPFFLVVHFFDPHRHYDAPPPFRGRFTGPYAEVYGEAMDLLESRLLAEQRLDWDFLVAAYDEEIAFVDHQVGRLAARLRELGLWGSVLMIFTADHGEGFQEHPEAAGGHGSSLYNEVLRVPLVIWGPEVRPGRYRAPVSLVDVVPTILDAVGLPAPERLPGLSLWPVVTAGAELPQRMLFAQNDQRHLERVAVIRWPLKAVLDPRSGHRWLFDLEKDPGEHRDLAGARAGELYAFLRAIQRALAEGRDAEAPEKAELDPRLRRQLRALGYLR